MSIQTIDPQNFEATVAQEGIVVVDCWAPWCGPCKMFGPIFEQTAEKHPQHVFAKLNTDDHQELAQTLRIQSIPTLMVFRDGILLYREAGAVAEPALQTLISQVEGLDMDDVRRQLEEQMKQEQAQAGADSGKNQA
jgi:thioredoxin 1